MKEENITNAINNISSLIYKTLKDKGLISLFIAGTILNPKERTSQSDIDFFAIVEPYFDLQEENELNNKLKQLKDTFCLGFESRLRCFDTDYLSGGKPKNFIQEKIFKPGQIIKKFPHFKLIWGKKFDFDKDFIEPISHKEEAKHLIEILEKTTKDVRKGKQQFPLKDFPKFTIELARLEAEALHGMKYTIERKKIQKHLSKNKNHIIHEAMYIREHGATREEIIDFCNKIDKYIKDVKEKLL